MSRTAYAALLICFSGHTAWAQETSEERVAEAIETARKVYTVIRKPAPCGVASNGDIVVCAPDRGEKWRVPPTSETEPTSLQALRNGIPRAPQLDRGSCRGQSGCVTGGWAPPPVYMIDLSAIPEAPEGSDADKIAKGEMSDR